jgi:hypothetical protein
MLEKLEELKKKSEELFNHNSTLRKITIDISKPKIKTILINAFWITFGIVFFASMSRYLLSGHAQHYKTSEIILGSFIISIIVSLILVLIITFPINTFVKQIKSKKFANNKNKIDVILQDVNKVYLSLNDYPEILWDYLNSFYLDKLIEYLKTEEISLEEAINRLEEEKYENKKFSYQIKVADMRIDNINYLFKLSESENITTSYDKWMENYTLN